MAKINRDRYPEKKILLSSEDNRLLIHRIIKSLPIFSDSPLEIVIREEVKTRGKDQNALYWSGPLADFEKQVFINGYTYTADEWHDELRLRFMPDENLSIEELEKHVKNFDSYRKYKMDMRGNRVLDKKNCTTTKLTKFGMSQYLEEIYAYGATVHGVMFSISPKESAKYVN